jgi:hypothetical protein
MRDGRISTPGRAFSTRRDWGRVAEVAASQYGVVSRSQLEALGAGSSTVGGWLRARRLIRMHSGVFAVGHASLTREGHFLAAVLACGPGAVLSYASAGALWEIRTSAAAMIDVTTPLRTGRGKAGLRVHRGDRVRPDEVTDVNSVPCTTVARTLLDLAVVLSPRGVEATVEASERLGRFDLRSLTLLLARHRGRRGTAKLRRALGAFDEEVLRARSETEARFFHLCLDHGLPRPLVNRTVEAAPASLEVDFHWPDSRLIVETDSPFHDTTAAVGRDLKRDAALHREGWTVIRCRWDDIVGDPIPLLARIRPHLKPATGAFR